jgi:hypothetical protein
MEGASLRKITVKVSLPPPASAGAMARDCARMCAAQGLSASVTPTYSAVGGDDSVFAEEAGASIELHACSREAVCGRLWPALLAAYPLLECAHVHEAGRGFNGCVFDYMRESSCPAALRRKKGGAPAPAEKG